MPLTAEDLLDPQVGDHVTQNSWHVSTAHQLFGILLSRYESRPGVLVTSDLKIFWGIPGLQNPSPDLAVIPGVRDRNRFRRSFRVKEEEARPVLAVELVSDEPEHQSADHDKKVEIYQRAGVPEYLVIDPPSNLKDCQVTGYRLNPAGSYEPIPPDPRGRILSRTTGLWFAPAGRTVDLIDAETGERLLTDREARKLACELEEENARLRAELERLRNSRP